MAFMEKKYNRTLFSQAHNQNLFEVMKTDRGLNF